jgi:flavin reductase (DIM6/NTAB) family NADH-FMN oxidoreductase RutF
MFYEVNKGHGLKYNPFKGCIVPRPIAWISSISLDGVTNLAPYSYFNAVAEKPPIVMFASGGAKEGGDKDSLRNIEETKEFVVNIVSSEQRVQMIQTSTSLPYQESEIDYFQIPVAPSNLVKPPRVATSPVSLECRYLKTIQLPKESEDVSNKVVFGEVVAVHIDDEVMTDGKVDIRKLKPLCRLGYKEYSVILDSFELERPAKI